MRSVCAEVGGIVEAAWNEEAEGDDAGPDAMARMFHQSGRPPRTAASPAMPHLPVPLARLPCPTHPYRHPTAYRRRTAVTAAG
eukprot:216470-Chlamydomonas_euryale.AAC.2